MERIGCVVSDVVWLEVDQEREGSRTGRLMGLDISKLQVEVMRVD